MEPEDAETAFLRHATSKIQNAFDLEAIGTLPEGFDTPCTPDIFSQGQWQLLSIARAVAADPKLLLLDEITANLDAETERAVLRALKRATADRTVLSISHRVGADTGRLIPIGEES